MANVPPTPTLIAVRQPERQQLTRQFALQLPLQEQLPEPQELPVIAAAGFIPEALDSTSIVDLTCRCGL